MTDKLTETVERAIAGLIAGNNMPDMSGDNRNRLSPMQRLLCTRVAKAAIEALTPPAGDDEIERVRIAAAIVNMTPHEFEKWASEAETYPNCYKSLVDLAYARADRVLAALSRPNVDEGWRPIETAPMWAVAVVTDGENVAISQKAESDFAGHYWAVDPDGGLGWEPTHWTPLPVAALRGSDQ